MEVTRKSRFFARYKTLLIRVLILQAFLFIYLIAHYPICSYHQEEDDYAVVFVYSEAITTNNIIQFGIMPLWLLSILIPIICMIFSFKAVGKMLIPLVVSLTVSFMWTLICGITVSFLNTSSKMVILSVVLSSVYLVLQMIISLPLIKISKKLLRHKKLKKTFQSIEDSMNDPIQILAEDEPNFSSALDQQRYNSSLNFNMQSSGSIQEENVTKTLRKLKLENFWRFHNKKSNDSIYNQGVKPSNKESSDDLQNDYMRRLLQRNPFQSGADKCTQPSFTSESLLNIANGEHTSHKIVSIVTDSELDDRALWPEENNMSSLASSPQFQIISKESASPTKYLQQLQGGTTDPSISPKQLLRKLTNDSKFRKEWIKNNDVQLVLGSTSAGSQVQQQLVY